MCRSVNHLQSHNHVSRIYVAYTSICTYMHNNGMEFKNKLKFIFNYKV
jgi:hypothetical protein